MKHNLILTRAGSGLIANYIASFSPYATGLNHQWEGNTGIPVGLHIPAKACMGNCIAQNSVMNLRVP